MLKCEYGKLVEATNMPIIRMCWACRTNLNGLSRYKCHLAFIVLWKLNAGWIISVLDFGCCCCCSIISARAQTITTATSALKCKHHCLFYSIVVAQTGHKQTGTCLCLWCNSECIVFGKVVQVQLVPERESRMEDKTTVMSTTGCQIQCRTRQQWCFITTNHRSFFLFFNWLVLRVSDNSNVFQTWGHFPLPPSGSKRHWRWSLPLAFCSPSFSPAALSARRQQSRALAGLTCISNKVSICIHDHSLCKEF